MRFFVLILSFVCFPFGLAGFAASLQATGHGVERDVPEDGLQAAQTVVADYAGFERDNQCHWGDEDRIDGGDPSCKTCDDGRSHPHWICDDGVLLRPKPGAVVRESWRGAAQAVTPAMEVWSAFLLLVMGGAGVFWLIRTRDD